MKPNYQRVTSLKFIIWTQAGFSQACKAITDGRDMTIVGYPTAYPSYTRFVAGYEGYHFFFAECVPLSKAVDNLKWEIETLIKADELHNETN